jgi:hypothetical protein
VKSKVRLFIISVLLSCLGFFGVEATNISEEDDRNMDDNEHMFI